MRIVLGVFLLMSFVACTGGRTTKPVNRWADERLWPVLEAQDHRDIEKLCAFLFDSSAVVREAAALAFASVQDSTSTPCLLKALGDAEASVRSSAVFALGFVADSAIVQRMAEAAMEERDSTVQRAYLSASFISMQRNGLLKDPNAILYYLDRAEGQERVRAADVLRRLPDSTVTKLEKEIAELMTTESAGVRPFLILAMRKLGERADRSFLEKLASDPVASSEERVNAIRVLGKTYPSEDARLFADLLLDTQPVVRSAALEELEKLPCPLPVSALSDVITIAREPLRWIPVFGLLQRCPSETATPQKLGLGVDASPYVNAEMIEATAQAPQNDALEEFLRTMKSERPAVERQAAFQGAVHVVRENMARARYASREAQYAKLGEVMATAVNTGDAGLICAVAELLGAEEPDVIRILFPPSMEKAAFAPLQPIRDLEARILLSKAMAKRDGLPPPEHERPPFNHPIDKARLLALKQGQQYRIVTNKGEVVIATDVNECPGSSLAFDSLVTAGYYNGKYFHRMVPNFVVQGGCPRGDGYGGMPWTLRTEIGHTPFTAGSVGLASAGPDTESCQFFITHSATPHLDGRYTRFGEVVSGMDVVWQLQVGDVMTRVERIE